MNPPTDKSSSAGAPGSGGGAGLSHQLAGRVPSCLWLAVCVGAVMPAFAVPVVVVAAVASLPCLVWLHAAAFTGLMLAAFAEHSLAALFFATVTGLPMVLACWRWGVVSGAPVWRQLMARYANWTRGTFLLGGVFLAYALVFSGLPWWVPTQWTAAYLAVWRRVPVAANRGDFRKRLLTGGLFVVSLALGFAIVEVGARAVTAVRVIRPQGLYVYHPKALFTLESGFEGALPYQRDLGEFDEFHVEISEQGLRDRYYGPKPAGTIRVLMLGDSHVMGWALPSDKTVPRQLERALNSSPGIARVEVINGGVGGYGPWQERVFLEERCMPLEPDLVIFQIFPGNDVENTLARVNKLPESYSTGQYRLVQEMRRKSEWPTAVERWLRKHVAAYRLAVRALRAPGFLVRTLRATRFYSRTPGPEPPPSRFEAYWVEVHRREYYPVLEEGWRLLEEDVRDIAAFCQQHDLPLVGYVQPDICSVLPAAWAALEEQFPDGFVEPQKDVRLGRAVFERSGIPYVSIDDVLRDHPDTGSLLYGYDGHMNEKGARLVAEHLADYLVENYAEVLRAGQ